MFLGLLVVTIGFAGCASRKKEEPRKPNTEVYDVDIPMADDDDMSNVFDDGTNEPMKADEVVYDDMADQNLDLADAVYTDNIIYDDIADLSNNQIAADDFSWIQESSDDFKKIYFEFDKHTLKEDQQEAIESNAEKAKEILAIEQGRKVTLVIEGHSDHAAGSDAYNLALSEKRAKTEKDYLVNQGVPADVIKVVGRGSEVPALVDGRPVEGDRNQQWPNRRDEMRVIYS